MRRLVVIPTYNERENIAVLLPRVRELGDEILVVDDRGTDDTAGVVARLAARDEGIHLLAHESRTGYAASLREGWNWALGHGYEVIAQMDADGNHDPADLPALYAALADADLAIGSRYAAGGRTPGWSRGRRTMSRLAGQLARRLLALPLADPTAGFRAWRASALRTVVGHCTRAQGFAVLVEATYYAIRSGARVREVPIVFRPRQQGRSKLSSRVLGDWWRTVWSLRREVRR